MLKKKNRLYTTIFLVIWTILLALIPLGISFIEKNNFKNNMSYISSEFNIEDYNIVLDVDKDNKIDVTEKFTVNMPSGKSFNGIYKSIPLWQKYHENDKEIKKKVKVTNLRAIGEKFVLNNTCDSIGIRIGSSRTTTNSGLHTYTIKYRYDMGIDFNNNLDELIFNVFDSYDNTAISNLDITINMPERITNENIAFVKGTQDITSKVNYTINDKTLNAVLSDYLLDESITVKMLLPNGYFVGTTYNYGVICFIICVSLIIISIISFILWTKHGKDYNKKCKTVEFYPPEDLDSAQIGYIYGEKSMKKLTSSLIIGLASKGYIEIKEIEKNKYEIINIGKNKSNLRKMSITEQIVYIELFKNGDTNILSEDRTFSNVFNKISITLQSTIDKKINDIKARKMMNITFTLSIISVVAWLSGYIYIKDLDPHLNWLYTLSFIAIFITGFFSIIMERKTAYGEMIIAKVMGFRNYLDVAEKNQIELLAEENANYFYDILPYAYVLNVSKKWIDKFDKKNIPNIDLSALDYYENNLFMIMT